jgi:hypothetical protein
MKRQKIRKTIQLVSMLLFPVTLNYFSPYLIIQGSLEGVLAGSGNPVPCLMRPDRLCRYGFVPADRYVFLWFGVLFGVLQRHRHEKIQGNPAFHEYRSTAGGPL